MARGKGRDKRQDLKAKEKADNTEAAENGNGGGITKELYLETAGNYRTQQADADETRGEMGSTLKLFEERGGNKKAFKIASWLKKQEPTKRDDFLRTLAVYCEWEGIEVEGLTPKPDLVDAAAPAPDVPSIPKGASAH